MDPNNRIIIFTKGFCPYEGSLKPYTGAWVAELQYGSHSKTLSGILHQTNSIRVQLEAAAAALRAINGNKKRLITVYSTYHQLAPTMQNRIEQWEKHGWYRQGGQAVMHPDLWQELLKFKREHEITWLKLEQEDHKAQTLQETLDLILSNHGVLESSEAAPRKSAEKLFVLSSPSQKALDMTETIVKHAIEQGSTFIIHEEDQPLLELLQKYERVIVLTSRESSTQSSNQAWKTLYAQNKLECLNTGTELADHITLIHDTHESRIRYVQSLSELLDKPMSIHEL